MRPPALPRSAPLLAALLAIAGGWAGQADACTIVARLDPADVRHADVVVTGRIANYRIVPDPAARALNRKRLADPKLPAELREMLKRRSGYLTDYARFDIIVDAVLVGAPAKTIRATWDNSTFAEPKQAPAGRMLIALRAPTKPPPPLRGPSATISPSREPGTLTLLQAPCAPAFLFPVGSKEAAAVRGVLGVGGEWGDVGRSGRVVGSD